MVQLSDKAAAMGAANKHQEAADIIINEVLAPQAKMLQLLESFARLEDDLGLLVGTASEQAASGGKTLLLFLGAAASSEQAQGIGQIAKAVNEMENVVQRTAANAEQSASASEEMSGQAEQMKAFVTELVTMVGGATVLRKKPASKKGARGPKVIAPYEKKANGHLKAGNGKGPVLAGKRNLGLEQVIPFDDAEVSDF